MKFFTYFSILPKDIKPLFADRIKMNSETWNQYIIYYSNKVGYLNHDKINLYMLGDIYGFTGKSTLFEIYYNPRKALDIDGMFTLIFVTPVEIKIISDLSGLYPLYYSYKNGKIFLSSISYEIAKILKASPNLDEIKFWIVSGRTTPHNTVYDGIKALAAEEVFTVNNYGKYYIYTYQLDSDFEDTSADVKDVSIQLIEIMKRGYLYLSQKFDLFLSDLSGGSDSRITSFIGYNTIPQLDLYVSNRDPYDKKFSYMFKEKCMPTLKYFPPPDSNFEKNIDIKEIAYFIVTGLTDCRFISSIYRNNLYKGENYDILISGFPGEIYKDFWTRYVYPRSKLKRNGIGEKELYTMLKYMFIRRKSSIDTKEVIGYLRSQIDVNMHLRMDKIIDEIYLRYFERFGIANLHIGSIFIKLWFPFLTNQSVKLARTIPYWYKEMENIHSNVLFNLDSKCCYIPTRRSIMGIFFPFKLEPKEGTKKFKYTLLENLYIASSFIEKVWRKRKILFLKQKGHIQRVYDEEKPGRIKEKRVLSEILGPEFIETLPHYVVECLERWFDYLN